ncbi:O-antigen ligase family protein [Halobacteriovorax sp. GB3]|uniref:O-antigen ligase family protein n=1 Tax=Halobacteriovorax sp. GB3 TaxID=2719615 RepID=UPI00235E5A8F|nr:O-antigen ligase family protein [Halobacteriovorax sp. GB3]MDD0852529.1 O-antigen ligase family protein [Halobacteriovorax sp. GB3]
MYQASKISLKSVTQNQIYVTFILALSFLIPLGAVPKFDNYPWLSGVKIIFAFLFLYFGASYFLKKQAVKFGKLESILVLFSFSLLPSIFFKADLKQSLITFISVLGYCLLVVVLRSTISNFKRLNFLVNAFLASSLFAVFIAFYQFFTGKRFFTSGYTRPFLYFIEDSIVIQGTENNANAFAYLMIAPAVLSYAYSVVTEDPKKSMKYFLLSMPFVFTSYLTLSRAAIFSIYVPFISLSLFYIFFMKGKISKILKFGTLHLFLIFCWTIVYPTHGPEILISEKPLVERSKVLKAINKAIPRKFLIDTTNYGYNMNKDYAPSNNEKYYDLAVKQTSSQWRLLVWKINANLFLKNPVFGVGYDQSKFYATGLPGQTRGDVLTPHNNYLGVASELGLFGLIPFFAFFILTLVYAVKSIIRSSGEQKVVLFVLTFGMLSHLFFGIFHTTLINISAWYVVGLLVCALSISGSYKSDFFEKNKE